ncbi:sugar ABC transporter ATP-binding protein [Consotaella salsifontis]|uniref:Monosaccharide ABC transporter ATP-binding protein, CUT2 family n=1 Tax=Consotaella salsifontis TaxID=1365950 RepID=A0A1T4QXH4_9HYPH|nr:sugar ABC transporter ATP-binding protein [Consotaella salsifontis]SKA08414.1 monosaccharide ABC transporter ATP-binding protein, CUT2 family [Consotaella salsifontis]
MTNYAIEIRGVEKNFGGIRALSNFNLKVEKGTVHAICGENGAGKSTLMKILSGIYIKDGGTVVVHGEEVNFTNPQQSRARGIGIVHQELALSPDLSVAENIFLDDLGQGGQTVNWKEINDKAGRLLTSFGFPIDPKKRVGDLSVAYQQMVEITKSLAKDVSILILDEPTAVLAGPEIEILFSNLRMLKAKGVTILYISHRLEEIFRIADAITVVKDGVTVTDLDPKTCTEKDVVTAMVGRELKSLYPPKDTKLGDVHFEIRHLTRRGVLDDINLTVRKGEIVGLAGLVGSGRTEIAECIFGIASYQKGEILKAGQPVRVSHPADAVRQGIGLVPEDRKRQGAVLAMGIDENMTMSKLSGVSKLGVIRHGQETSLAASLKDKLRIKLGRLTDPVSSLSGGNQQKVVLAKWLNVGCDFLVFDEPTRGVDVGAKSEIYNIIHGLAEEGCALLVISSELVELIGLCHRVYVMSEGHVTGELSGDQLTEPAIMSLAIPKRMAS